MEAHKPAVWAVAGLYDVDGTKRILTGEGSKRGEEESVVFWRLCVGLYFVEDIDGGRGGECGIVEAHKDCERS